MGQANDESSMAIGEGQEAKMSARGQSPHMLDALHVGTCTQEGEKGLCVQACSHLDREVGICYTIAMKHRPAEGHMCHVKDYGTPGHCA